MNDGSAFGWGHGAASNVPGQLDSGVVDITANPGGVCSKKE